MKTLYLLAFALLSLNLSANEHIIETNSNLISIMAGIKSTAESYRTEMKTWSGDDKNKGMSLYIDVKSKSDAVIAKYKTIIDPSWRKAKKKGITIDKELENLEIANNNLVTFFKDQLEKKENIAHALVVGEIIDIVFKVGKNIYNILVESNEKNIKTWTNQINEQKIIAW